MFLMKSKLRKAYDMFLVLDQEIREGQIDDSLAKKRGNEIKDLLREIYATESKVITLLANLANNIRDFDRQLSIMSGTSSPTLDEVEYRNRNLKNIEQKPHKAIPELAGLIQQLEIIKSLSKKVYELEEKQ